MSVYEIVRGPDYMKLQTAKTLVLCQVVFLLIRKTRQQFIIIIARLVLILLLLLFSLERTCQTDVFFVLFRAIIIILKGVSLRRIVLGENQKMEQTRRPDFRITTKSYQRNEDEFSLSLREGFSFLMLPKSFFRSDKEGIFW